MSTILTKHQTVLHYIGSVGSLNATFVNDEREQTISWDAWKDMGRPDTITVTITVTIEPGDRLNEV